MNVHKNAPLTPGAHAILLLDQAGWHGAKALKVPNNIIDAAPDAIVAGPAPPSRALQAITRSVLMG